MKERWVVNASPIICLAKAGQIGLLLNLADEIIIPAVVWLFPLSGHWRWFSWQKNAAWSPRLLMSCGHYKQQAYG